MEWKSRPIVAFDTETTGLEPFGGDRVIEFGAVVLRLGPDGRVAERTDHSWLINPEMPIPRKVTELTGISDADLVGKPLFADVAEEIHALLVDSVAVAHNFPFDLAFLSEELKRVGMRWPDPIAEVDTVDLSMRCFPEARGHRLSDLCARLDVPLENAHRATDDAAACGMCFAKLARQHEVGDELQEMLDWAHAIGRPPEGGPFRVDPDFGVVFGEGPHENLSIASQPVYLQWMTKARARGPQGWTWRYPESARRWAQRWLQVRAAGRARSGPKGFHEQDWALESCIAVQPERPRP